MGKSRCKKNRFVIESELEDAIIDVWCQFEGELRSRRRNSQVLMKMLQVLKFQGYEMPVASLKSKIHNLRTKYVKENVAIQQNGGGPSKWRHYGRVHALIESNRLCSADNLGDSFPVFVMESGLEEAIIDAWTEHEEELRGMKRNSQVLAKMADVLKLQGFEMPVEILKSKVDHLRNGYVKDDRVHKSSTTNNVTSLVKENVLITGEDSMPSSSSSSELSPTPQRKRKRNDILDKIDEIYKRCREQDQEDMERLMAMEHNFLEVEKKKAEALANISDAFRKITETFFEREN